MFQADPRGILALVAITEAMQGDGIAENELALLNRLRDTLGIAKTDADALERDLKRDTASASLTS